MKSPVVKRSVVIGGHKTSVSLEEAFWDGMKEISRERGKTISELVSEIDDRRQQGNLSSAIRLFVLDHFRTGAAGPADVAIAQGSSPDGSGGKSAGEVRNPAGRTQHLRIFADWQTDARLASVSTGYARGKLPPRDRKDWYD